MLPPTLAKCIEKCDLKGRAHCRLHGRMSAKELDGINFSRVRHKCITTALHYAR